MLKGIDPLLDAGLLGVLAAMGHGDEIAIVDANFPAVSVASRLVRVTGASLSDTVRAILSVYPLEEFVSAPLIRMEVVGKPNEIPDAQRDVHRICEEVTGQTVEWVGLERFAFYERARHAYAVVATSERRPYGCVLLTKGVVASDS